MTLSREAQIAEAGAQIAPDPLSGASVSDTATERTDATLANAPNDNAREIETPVVKETAPVESAPPVDAPKPDPSPQKRSRDEIAARFKANRPQVDDEQTVFDNAGNHVPSWLKPAEEEPPAPANDQAANDDQPETFKLKVLGNEISVTFDELAKQAGLEPDEAKDLPKASLIRLAQKNAAADAYLDEAKATVKSARTARAPGDTQPEAERTTTPVRKEADPSGEPTDGDRDEADQPDEFADIVKEIQFGDEKEAARKLREAVAREAQQSALADQQRVKHEAVQRDIGAAVTTFEAANADVISDPDLGPIFYGRYLVDEVKTHLIASGKVTKEVADRVIQSPADALAAYEGVKVAGIVQMPDPAAMLSNALTRFRGKFGAPATGSQPEATRTLPAMADRQALKRSLPSQPSRSGVPLAVAPGKVTDGQAPAARASIVERMRIQRSANGRGLSKAA